MSTRAAKKSWYTTIYKTDSAPYCPVTAKKRAIAKPKITPMVCKTVAKRILPRR